MGTVAIVASNHGANTKGPDARVQGVGLDVKGESLGEDLGRDDHLVEVTVVLGLVLGMVNDRPAISQEARNSLKHRSRDPIEI